MAANKSKPNKPIGGLPAARAKEPLIRINKVVELTGFSRSYIYKLTHWKKIPCYKPTNGQLFFYESEIMDFLVRIRQAAEYEMSEQADALLNKEGK
ncbi:MAG: helix-turn-helix domain-containing protein [Treponema sp.]|nr:helix-turn-helix domain-containing protein [Treponema sp.]